MARGASNVTVMAISKQNVQTEELAPSKRLRRLIRSPLNRIKKKLRKRRRTPS